MLYWKLLILNCIDDIFYQHNDVNRDECNLALVKNANIKKRRC